MNEILRQALFRAGLSDESVAVRLGVDPKTVRRWLDGRLPYPRLRWELARLLGIGEGDLWPELGAAERIARRPPEVVAIYPHRSSVSFDRWHDLFESAADEIAVLAYSALFIAEEPRLVALLRSKADAGVRVRLALGDPDWWQDGGRATADVGDAQLPDRIRRSLELFQPVYAALTAELRLHRIVVYNSMVMTERELFVAQRVYGVAAAQAPVLHLREAGSGDLSTGYRESFEVAWASAATGKRG